MYIRYLTLFITLLFCSTGFTATDKAEPTTGFNLTGYIQTFKLKDPNDPLSQAEINVNGTTVIIPKNLKIVMPGTYLTANDIFRGKKGTSSTPATDTSCIALDDREKSACAKQPEFPYTAEIVGNIVDDKYIAGLVNIGQIPLQTSAGFVRTICYEGTEPECTMKGEILVSAKKDGTVFSRVRLNDPKVNDKGGRFGAAESPDERFKVDQDNPTVHAATGYPVCIPRNASGDDLCPMKNRPKRNGKFLSKFTMGDVPARNSSGTQVSGAFICEDSGNDAPKACDSHEMVPLVLGDYIVYSGTLQKDTNGKTYISAYSLEADLGVYTSPGVDPAYVFIEEVLVGAGGTAFPGIDQETGPGKVLPGQNIINRFKIVGFTTDPSRSVDVYAMDVKNANSVEKIPRKIKSFDTEVTAPIGRFEDTIDSRIFMPPTREIRAQINGIWGTDNPDVRISSEPELSANGLTFGRYDAPVAEYIFPEGRVFGGKEPETGLIPANFEDLCFLSVGYGQLDTLDREPGPGTSFPIVGRLDPWPDSEKVPFQTIPSKSAHQPPGIFCQ